MRVFKSAVIILAAASVFVFSYGLTMYLQEKWSRPLPVIPVGYTLVEEHLFTCTQPFVPEGYGRAYASPAHPEMASIITYGKVSLVEAEFGFQLEFEEPFIWVFYPDDGLDHPFVNSTYRIITLPGVAPEYVSIEELKERFPRGPCS